MWARPRAKIRGVWRVLAGLKARCSGVSGLTFAIRGQSSTKPGPINFRGCGERGSMFLLDLYNIRTSVARAIAHKQQSSILLLV